MGFFSVFCGILYNDFFSVPLEIFQSCYNLTSGERLSDSCVYPVGIDPVWYISTQEIQVLNSLKMKTSVIFGVCHMTLGIMLKGLNHHFEGQKLEFWNEFVP
jgi:V-type H+-transporting ATPase subunit a